MTLCGTLSPEDIEQLSSFCSFFGVYTVESHGDIPLRGERREVCLLERREEECTEIEQVTCNKNIYEFAKFCCGNFDDIEFETVYSYFAGKVNKGQSNIYYTTENGKIITGAIATFYAYDTVYITFVSTDKAHRGQGRARGLISHIAGLNRGKKIQLMCEEELKPFYLKLGFAQIENLTLYNLRNERI
ncbi:MAG: GNAT family N-acetyltransferase, partial [Oscillospiraceae bacterium]